MNYGELKTQFQSILNRRDLTESLRTTFIEMSLSRIQRELRVPLMEKAVEATTGSSFTGLEIPSDYLKLIALTVKDNETKLQRVDLQIAETYAESIGIPKVFARQGSKWVLGPTPSEGLVMRIDYYAEFADLTEDSDSNVLTNIAPDLIIYGALVYAAEYFLDRRLEPFENRYQTMLMEIQHQADQDELSTAFMRACYNVEDETL